jgi:hypothetical protein
MTFGEKAIDFYRNLRFAGRLPAGINIMNPFRSGTDAMGISEQFYGKFFNDHGKRIMLLGINPGRFGAGTTGIPFTDTIRLNEKCGIACPGMHTYEPSSAFIYEMIDACGGVQTFYNKFFISAICPLGFVRFNEKGRMINYNYYDSPALTRAAYDFILETLKQQLAFGIVTDVCYCLGTGKNEKFLRRLNAEHQFFSEIIALEHPRYIMQYKAKSKLLYIRKYQEALGCS